MPNQKKENLNQSINSVDASSIIDGNQLVASVINEDPFLDVCLDKLNNLPDVADINRVVDLKKQIDDGTYNFDEKLAAVVDSLIDESVNPNPLSYPVFDS